MATKSSRETQSTWAVDSPEIWGVYPNKGHEDTGYLWCLLGQLLGCPSASSSSWSSSSSSLLSCSLFRPKFLQNEVRVKKCIFYFCSSVARFTPMNMHVRVRTHRYNMFCCQIQIAGEVLPVKCPAKFLSEECGEVCGERSAKCLLLCSSLKIPPEISQQTSTCTTASDPNKIRRRNFLHQIYSLRSSWHNLGSKFVGSVF